MSRAYCASLNSAGISTGAVCTWFGFSLALRYFLLHSCGLDGDGALINLAPPTKWAQYVGILSRGDYWRQFLRVKAEIIH